MAKKTTTNAPATNDTTNGNDGKAEKSKAQIVREYKEAHPEATPAQISKALAKEGVDVGPGRVSGVLRQGKTSTRISAEQIKAAAAVLRNAKSVDEAEQQLTQASEVVELLRECKNDVEAAKSALRQADELRGAFGC